LELNSAGKGVSRARVENFRNIWQMYWGHMGYRAKRFGHLWYRI